MVDAGAFFFTGNFKCLPAYEINADAVIRLDDAYWQMLEDPGQMDD
jgi:hypothetical protein